MPDELGNPTIRDEIQGVRDRLNHIENFLYIDEWEKAASDLAGRVVEAHDKIRALCDIAGVDEEQLNRLVDSYYT